MNKTEAINAPLAELERKAWELLTNVKSCGGASKEGRRVVQRRLRAAGWRFCLQVCEVEHDDGYVSRWSDWSLIRPGCAPIEGDCVLDLVTGVSLDHCAHKLGHGNAVDGWRFFHST